MFLLFKKEFFDAIRQGRKTQTIRFWTRQHVKPGRIISSPHLGRFQITEIDELDPDLLTDDDARPDGFESADQLRAKLVELYGSTHPEGRRCFRVRFNFLGKPDKPTPATPQ